MANIQPNANGKVARVQKRLRRRLGQLRNASNLTAGQRDMLFAAVLEDLVLLELRKLNQLREDD